MPIYTKHYNLAAFAVNDKYSASKDKSRFTIIDNQLSFLSEIVGEGIIKGWDISDISYSNSLAVSVSPGMGLINGFVTRTFGDITQKIEDDSVVYLYMQKKLNYLGGFGGYSKIDPLFYTDSTPPPVALYVNAVSWDYNYIKLSWDNSPALEPDFSTYIIYRSEDGFISQTLIGETPVNSFTDSSVEENTSYEYRIVSEDRSENQSVPSVSSGVITTLKDLIPPLDPTYLLIFPGDGFIDVAWRASASGTTVEYEIKTEELDSEYNVVGTISSYTVDGSINQHKVDGLVNGTFYKITIYSISKNGVNSSGISMLDAPAYNLGPAEVEDISVSSSESIRNQYGISLNISWIPGADPYNEKPYAYRYVITLIENGYVTSEPFYVYEENELDVELFYSNGEYYPIKQRTDYIVKIEAEDEKGNLSNGVIARTVSKNFKPPYSPTSLSYNIDENSNLIFSWQNSSSNFDHNLLSLTRTDATSLVVTTLESNIDYGKNSTYRIDNVDVVLNSIYELSLQAVDDSSLSSSIVKTTYTSPNTSGNYIAAPTGVIAYHGDGNILLSWNKVTAVVPKFYKIWRANYKQYGLKASDFSLVDIIPAEFTTYEDMSVANGVRYYYFVTTVDIYNRESRNPVNNNYSLYSMAFGYSVWDTFFAPITNLAVVADGYNVIVSWDTGNDNFDGYEIYRYAPTGSTWEKVGYANKEFGVFIDVNALLVTGTYHYIVRKFRNEAQLLVSSSSVVPIRSVLLGKITSNSGVITIDTSLTQHVADLEKVASDYVAEITPIHKHSLANNYDRRIDLIDNIVVSDWTTTDNQTFTTTQDISGANSFIPLISDTTISYEVNTTEKKIVFSKNIGTSILSVQCVGLSEVLGILPYGKIADVSATQIYSGKIPEDQIGEVDHAGYVKAPLIPLQMPMSSTDGYLFSINQNGLEEQADLGFATTFYDITRIQDGSIVAVTSSGIMSNSTGDWTIIFTPDGAPHKIFYAQSIDQYFVLTGKSVYISSDALTWVRCNGLDDVGVVRDIVYDGIKYVYVSTDKGVYSLDINSILGLYLTWVQLPFVNENSSNCYALLYENGRLYVSCDSGVFYSDVDGQNFYELNEIDSDEIIRLFYSYGGYIFALTDTSVWRKSPSDLSFSVVAKFDADMARKMVIFDDRLIISTDLGMYVSSDEYDIYIESGLEFYYSLKKINFSSKIVPVTGLSVTDTYLNIGTDGRLFTGTSFEDLSTIYLDSTSIIPSVYVDGQLQVIGFTYYNSDNTVWFDDFVTDDKTVSVTNQYQLFKVSGQGWLDKKYAADVVVYKNGSEIATMTGGGFVVYAPFDQVSFETFTEFDSNSAKATAYQLQYEAKLEELNVAYTSGETELQSYVSSLVDLYNKTYSQVLGNVRFASTISIGDVGSEISYAVVDYMISPLDIYEQIFSEYELVPHIPPVIISDSNAIVSANVTDGFFEFTLAYNKYDKFTVDIKNTAFLEVEKYTHGETEDALEEINSGLPLSLSETQQSNIIKTGLFLEKVWAGEQNTVDQCNIPKTSTHKMDFFIPITNSWYDVLNSSVDYKKEIVMDDATIDVDYVSAALYVEASSVVLVGHPKGMISVSTIDLELLNVDFNGGKEEFVRDIENIDGNIYVLTDDNLYVSGNDGMTWQREAEMPGVTGKFKAINKLGLYFILTTTDGIFYKDLSSVYWTLASDLTSPNVLAVGSYAVSIKNGNEIQYSKNGVVWEEAGIVDYVRINVAKPYKKILLLGTDKGLRLDNSTFYTKSPATSLIDMLGDLVLSEGLKINDIAINPIIDEYVVGASNGKYYMWDGFVYTENNTTLETIQKIVCVDGDYWLFGYDTLKVVSMSYSIKLSSGIPL